MTLSKLSVQDQIQFFHRLHSLLDAGLPLLNSLLIILDACPQHWKAFIQVLVADLSNGNSVATSFSLHRRYFSPMCIGLIAVGEKTGHLDQSLLLLIKQLEGQETLRRQMIQALTYPCLTLGAAVLMVFSMLMWVIPSFEDIFRNFNADLPLITQILVQSSQGLEKYFSFIWPIFIMLIIFFGLFWIQSTPFQKWVDSQLFKLPFFGTLFHLSAQISWCQNVGHLLHSGLSALEAIRISAQSSNHWLSHDLSAHLFKQLSQGWEFGEAITRCDPQHRFFDAETMQLLRIGAKTGKLSEMLHKRSCALENQLHYKLTILNQSLEPVLIIFLGLLVAGLLMALYLPIFSLGNII